MTIQSKSKLSKSPSNIKAKSSNTVPAAKSSNAIGNATPKSSSEPPYSVSPYRSRERILVFGIEGSGKTKGFFDIVKYSGARGWIIDTDNSSERFIESENYSDVGLGREWVSGEIRRQGDVVTYKGMVEEGRYVRADGRLQVFHCRHWYDIQFAMEYVWRNAEWDDWIMIDSLTFCWDDVQKWYTEEIYGKSNSEFFMNVRRKQAQMTDGKTHTAGEAMFNEWQFINPQYQDTITDRIINPPCHLYMTAESTKVSDQELAKDETLRKMYGELGVKPKGQKRSGHNAQTILLLSKDVRFGEEKYELDNVAKDRERVRVRGEYGDLWHGYIETVAKWKR